jgi:hypothetical protein
MPRLNLRWDSPISRSLTASILVVSIGLVAQGCAPAPADDTSVTATDSATQQIMRGQECA